MRLRLLAVLVAPFLIASCGGGGGSNTVSGPTPPCVVTIAQLAMNVTATAGSSAIPVQAGTTCVWTTTSSRTWLSITANAAATGAATVTFSVAENTGAQRTANVTIGGVVVVVTQAAAPPPITWVLPAINVGVVGQPYNTNIATAAGGTGDFHYQLDTFGGFPPIGLILAPNGVISGTPTVTAAAASFRVCAVDTTGRQLCQSMAITVNAAGAAGDNLLGNWGGQIVLTVGCTAPLPQTYNWTGTIRRKTNGQLEILINVPAVLVINETWPVTLNGQAVTITIDFDSVYVFSGTLSGDNNTIASGTFVGGNCNVPPTIVLPRGTWNGTRR